MNSIIERPSWRNRLFSAITTALSSPWVIPGAAILGILFFIPSLWIGFLGDDFVLRAVMLGRTSFHSNTVKIFSAYSFITSNPAAISEAMERGFFPWWTVSEFTMSFLRYLSSASIWLDYQLWPQSPVAMHLHNLALYGGIVAAAAYFYRRVMGSAWIAGLAVLLFAIDSRHTGVVAWLANRHGLVSLLFTILCLIAYDAWRTSGKTIHAFTVPLLLGLGLFSGEMALATAGFLLSYALFLDTGPLKQRLAALIPSGAVFCFWAAAYKVLGHGVRGSAMYIDPTRNPAIFILGLIKKAPLFILGQFSPLPAESGMYLFSPETSLVIALIFTAALALVLVPYLRHDRTARFFTLAMACAIVPIAGTVPANRNLFFISFAAMPLVALILGGCVTALNYLPKKRAWRITAAAMGIALVATHLIISPLMIKPSIDITEKLMNVYTANIRSIPNDPKLESQVLVLVNPHDYILSIMEAYSTRKADGTPVPHKFRALAPCSGPIEIHRLDEHTLRVKTPEGLFKGFARNVYRPMEEPVKKGEEYRLTDVTMHINDADTVYGPTDVTYRFAVPLEDPSLRWLILENERYVPFVPPAAGETVMLEGIGFEELIKKAMDAK